jgi:hypothetical protein
VGVDRNSGDAGWTWRFGGRQVWRFGCACAPASRECRVGRAAGDAPIPARHRPGVERGACGEGGVDDGEARAPFEVGEEGGAELGVGGEALLVGGFEQEGEPALALLLGDAFAEVVLDHGEVAALVGGVVGRAAEDFGDEFCDVLEVLGVHASEERGEDGIGGDLLIEAVDEPGEGFGAA